MKGARQTVPLFILVSGEKKRRIRNCLPQRRQAAKIRKRNIGPNRRFPKLATLRRGRKRVFQIAERFNPRGRRNPLLDRSQRPSVLIGHRVTVNPYGYDSQTGYEKH